MVKIDFDTFNNYYGLSDYLKRSTKAYDTLTKDKGMTGWFDLDSLSSEDVLQPIESEAQRQLAHSDIMIVIAIGGSYIGSQAIINAMHGNKVVYAGHSLDSNYDEELWNSIRDKEICLNIVSKSGDTLETRLAYHFFLYKMKEKYPDDYKTRIVVTTGKNDGFFYQEVLKENYHHLIIPESIGGRFSVLTAVGLFPLVYSGFKIRSLFKGAKEVSSEDAIKYAALRDYYYHSGKMVENFAVYQECMLMFNEWIKQLFAETQGKMKQGLLPISTFYTRDLHSLGQYIQDGEPIMFETTICAGSGNNAVAQTEVAKAHLQNSCYSTLIYSDEINLYNLGYLLFFFELSAALGGYMLGVNPYNQPGVNEYKKNLKNMIEVI